MQERSPIERAIAKVGTAAVLAEALDVSVQAIGQWKAGARPIPAERCLAIERETAGTVTCEELLPSASWVRVKDKDWPHPKGRPLLDLAKPAPEAAEARAA